VFQPTGYSGFPKRNLHAVPAHGCAGGRSEPKPYFFLAAPSGLSSTCSRLPTYATKVPLASSFHFWVIAVVTDLM
jgi:hypothetical protein